MPIKLWNYIKSLPHPVGHSFDSSSSNSSPILALNALICLYLAFILGLNYSPISDGWVHYLGLDRGAHSLDRYVDRIMSLNLNSRILAKTPYIISSNIGDDGFMTGKVILFGLNILTGWGLYLFLSYVFMQKRIFAAICALFYFYFSFDGSMFWFGAWGINIGLCAMVFSMYLFLRAVDETSKLKLFWACLLVAVCFLCYPGPITWFAFTFFAIGFYWFKNLKSRYLYFVLYFIAFCLANYLFLSEMANAEGRSASVASFDAATGLSNTAAMLKGLFVETPASLLKPNLAHLGPAIVIGAFSFFAFRYIGKKAQSNSLQSEIKISVQEMLGLSVFGLGLIIAGMLPFVFTSVEMDGQRALIYARSGYVLIFVSVCAFGIGRVFKRNSVYQTALSVFGAVLICLAVQDKAAIAKDFHQHSLQPRKFLSHLSETVPDYKPGSSFLFYITPQSFNEKPGMVINRPSALVRYLYSDHSIQAVTVSPFRLNTGRVKIKDNRIKTKAGWVDLERVIALQYNEETGFTPLTEISIPKTGSSPLDKVIFALPGDQNIRQGELTVRQKWFLENRD